MPIKNLTDRPAAFPRIGELRKGAARTKEDIDKKRPGKDQHFFRFTPTDPKDMALLTLFNEVIAEKPTLIYVLLPGQKPDDNLEAWQEAWTAGSLQHRCDGERVVLELDKAGKHFIMNSLTPCPGGCKATGRLSVIVPALKRAGIVTVLTTSKNDLLNLSRSLDAAYQLRGDLRGIPFALSRVPRMISTPAADGNRARREKWLLNLEIAPQWFERQLAALQVSALPQAVNAPYLLEAGFDEEDDEDDESKPPHQIDTDTDEVTDAPEDSRPLDGATPTTTQPTIPSRTIDTTPTSAKEEFIALIAYATTLGVRPPPIKGNDYTSALTEFQAAIAEKEAAQ